jgi:hypothetical protein
VHPEQRQRATRALALSKTVIAGLRAGDPSIGLASVPPWSRASAAKTGGTTGRFSPACDWVAIPTHVGGGSTDRPGVTAPPGAVNASATPGRRWVAGTKAGHDGFWG